MKYLLQTLMLVVSFNAFCLEQATPTRNGEPVKTVEFSLGLSAGYFDADDEPQFRDTDDQYATGLGFDVTFPRVPWVGLSSEIYGMNQDFDTPVSPPPFGTISSTTRVETDALLLGVKAICPAFDPLRFYVAGGYGWYHSQMSAWGTLFGYWGRYESTENQSKKWTGAGISYRFGHWSLGLDYRHFDLQGDFDDFLINNAEIGGETFMLKGSWHFP